MKKDELKTITEEELKLKIRELKIELLKLNAQISTGTALKSPGQVKKSKRMIAKILTELNKRKGKIKGGKTKNR